MLRMLSGAIPSTWALAFLALLYTLHILHIYFDNSANCILFQITLHTE